MTAADDAPPGEPGETGETGVQDRLAAVHERLRAAERSAGRPAGSVDLLLATKTVDPRVVRSAVEAVPSLGGRRVLLGENRVQELVAKGPELNALAAELGTGLHLIGHLQSNKVAAALRWATCVQSVDSSSLARRLAARASEDGHRLDVMVQVNVSGESTKSGVPLHDAAVLASAVAGLAALRLCGFMTIGAHSVDPAVVAAGFDGLRAVRDAVLGSGAPGTEHAGQLSMGMSGDLEIAVAHGATLVRVGTAVFGGRPPTA